MMEQQTSKLIGETIKSARITCHQRTGCDSQNLLILEMESGATFYIEGGCGDYTGKSCGEYVEYVDVRTEHYFGPEPSI